MFLPPTSLTKFFRFLSRNSSITQFPDGKFLTFWHSLRKVLPCGGWLRLRGGLELSAAFLNSYRKSSSLDRTALREPRIPFVCARWRLFFTDASRAGQPFRPAAVRIRIA